MQLFTWMNHIGFGFKPEYLNIDEGGESKDVNKRLTVISNEKRRAMSQELGFQASEHDSLSEFFNKEIKKSDSKEVLRTL